MNESKKIVLNIEGFEEKPKTLDQTVCFERLQNYSSPVFLQIRGMPNFNFGKTHFFVRMKYWMGN